MPAVLGVPAARAQPLTNGVLAAPHPLPCNLTSRELSSTSLPQPWLLLLLLLVSSRRWPFKKETPAAAIACRPSGSTTAAPAWAPACGDGASAAAEAAAA